MTDFQHFNHDAVLIMFYGDKVLQGFLQQRIPNLLHKMITSGVQPSKLNAIINIHIESIFPLL